MFMTVITYFIRNLNWLVPLRVINRIQAGVFWNHIGWGGGGILCPRFSFICGPITAKFWHDGTLGQNLSKAIKFC